MPSKACHKVGFGMAHQIGVFAIRLSAPRFTYDTRCTN